MSYSFTTTIVGANVATVPDDHIITSVGTRSDIHFRATVESRSDIADDLLAIHGPSGADAVVASLHGIGKATVVKVANKGCFPLFCIGDVHAEIKSVEAQATKFMCAAYGKVAKQSHATPCQNAGSNVALKNREEWCIISETLFHSTNY